MGIYIEGYQLPPGSYSWTFKPPVQRRSELVQNLQPCSNLNIYLFSSIEHHIQQQQKFAIMPPKGGIKRKAQADGDSTPSTPSLAVQLSYLHHPRPFKNPNYTKNVNRRAKNLKTVLGQERERERAEREARRLEREELMKTDPTASSDLPEEAPTYTTIEAPPSVIPHKHLCDITGLEAPYTDPATGLRFHDKSVYEIVKGLNTSMAKDYLSARGVVSIVK